MRYKLIFLVLSLFASCVSLAHTKKTLVYCTEAAPVGFDPGQYTTNTDLEASSDTIFNRLVEFTRSGTQILPSLATKWAISKDGLTYTFTLRKGVKFHTTDYFKPTRDFNADDVVFTFSRMINPRHLFRLAYPTEFPYVSDLGLDKNIAKIFKIDPYTVKLILHKPDATLLANLAISLGSIQSFEYAQQLYKEHKTAEINYKPIGTGPFVFKSYTRDQQVRYVGNKQYWDKRPHNGVKLDELVFSITPDSKVRAQKLKTGECHVLSWPSPADVFAFRKDPDFTVLSQTGFNVLYIAYNVQKPPLNQLLVRQALDMAINKKALVKAAYQGLGQVAINPMPPAQWGYDQSIKNASYNPTKAKQLLKKAGYPNGFTIELWTHPKKKSFHRITAEMIQADWTKIGVKTKTVTYEWGEYISRGLRGKHQVYTIGGLGVNGDPDEWLGTFVCGANGNFSRWCDKSFSDLIFRARLTTNQTERTKLYQQAQKIFKKAVPETPIAYELRSLPIAKSVKNLILGPLGFDFRGVSIE